MIPSNYENDRRKSLSFNENSLKKFEALIIKEGNLKKKGLFFYNIRLVKLNAIGILSYYDPKQTDIVKSQIDLKTKEVIVKLTGKLKDHLEICCKD